MFKLLIDSILRLRPIKTGDIIIDGVVIKDYEIAHLRGQVCVIDMNPFIFKGTMR
jgi:ABC-type multidrug transport system fused ATPase/permease subunit